MKTKIVAVKDLALGEYLPVFQVPATPLAVRQFGDEVKSPDSPLSKHPEDYELWLLAELDTEHGTFDDSIGTRLARALDFV